MLTPDQSWLKIDTLNSQRLRLIESMTVSQDVACSIAVRRSLFVAVPATGAILRVVAGINLQFGGIVALQR